MTEFTITASGPIKLPTGVTVGDEFRIAGKCRVTAISEELVDAGQFSDNSPRLSPGQTSYALLISEIEPT